MTVSHAPAAMAGMVNVRVRNGGITAAVPLFRGARLKRTSRFDADLHVDTSSTTGNTWKQNVKIWFPKKGVIDSSPQEPTALPSVMQEANMTPLLLCIVLSWLLVLGLLFHDVPVAAPGGRTGKGGASVENDRLIRRLRNHKLLMTYLFWKAAMHDGRPPRLSDIRWQGHLDSPHTFLVAVEDPEQTPPRFCYLRIGSALEQRVGQRLTGLRTSEVHAQADDDISGRWKARIASVSGR
jgi:hypothetical protein